MSDWTGRTVICSTVFMDIVGASKAAASDQLAMKARLNAILSRAIANIAEADRLLLDTGDGAALCFFGDPEDALFVAIAVNEGTADESDAPFSLRTGIHLGPVKLVTDLTGRPNVLGDGINVAQRIMSFAEVDEVLVSRAYYEVVSRLRPDNESLFRFLGTMTDKHVREHQVYSYGAASPARGRLHTAEPMPRPAAARAGGGTAIEIAPDVLHDVESRLSHQIGPISGVLVRRAAAAADSLDVFYRILAAAIPDDADRAAFLGSAPHTAGAAEAPARHPGPAGPSRLAAGDLQFAERHLAQYLGPIAGVLVRKAAPTAHDRAALGRALAVHIDDETARRTFLKAMDGG